MARSIPLAVATMLAIQIAAAPGDASWRWASFDGAARSQILKDLRNNPGKHLVLARYNLAHDPGNEWVYNDADIDASPVVWARELDPASNEKLMRYFDSRQVWLVEPDLPVPHIRPYREAPSRPMPFVALGAPRIEVLRSPDQLRKIVRSEASGLHTCDEWNYYFTKATGITGPDVRRGCYVGDRRSELVSLDDWFAWLLRQR